MAWYPDAIAKPIPPGSNDPAIIPVGCVLHVAVYEGDSLHDYFDGPSGGIESTWYIRYDGTIEQYRDTRREADANYDGNSWFSGGRRYGLHSIETAGLEHGEWTDAQIRSIKELLAWDAREHDWPLQVAPSWRGPGVGYHVMWGAPGRWTPVSKTCPGPDRVKQFHKTITPWLRSGGGDDDMPSPKDWNNKDWDAFKGHLEDFVRYRDLVTSPNGEKEWSAAHVLYWLERDSNRNGDALARVLANQKAIMAAQGVEVDEQALAAEIATVLVPAVIEALPAVGLTEEQVEQTIRDVFGSLAD